MFLEWREFCVHKLPFLHEQVCQPHQLLPSLIAHNTRSCLGLDTSASSLLPATSPLTIHPPPVHSWMQIASNLLYNKVNIVILNLFYNKIFNVIKINWLMQSETTISKLIRNLSAREPTASSVAIFYL